MSGFSNGPGPLGANRTLWTLLGANLASTADQAFSQAFPFSKFVLDKIVVTNASGTITLAQGGIYSGAGKTGTAIVASTQLWTGLTSNIVVVNPTLTASGQNLLTLNSLFLSLTTPMGSAATADFFIMGIATA